MYQNASTKKKDRKMLHIRLSVETIRRLDEARAKRSDKLGVDVSRTAEVEYRIGLGLGIARRR